MVQDGDNLVNIHDASEILNVHPNTLRRWDEKGILKAVRFGERKDRHYLKSDLEKITRANNLAQLDAASRSSAQSNSQEHLHQLEQITMSFFLLETPEKLAKHMAQHVCAALGAGNCIIHMLSDDKKTLNAVGQYGYPMSVIKKMNEVSLSSRNPITESYFTRTNVVIESSNEFSQKYPHLQHKYYFVNNTASTVHLPLQVKSEVKGVITINFAGGTQFEKDDLRFLISIARHCSVAFERSFLYQNEKNIQIETEKIQRLLIQLNEAAARFLIPLNPEDTYEVIIDEAKKLMRSVHGSIFLLRDNALQRIYTSLPRLYQIIPRKRGRTYQALKEKSASYYHVKGHSEPHPLLKRLGIKTVIYIPLVYSDNEVGVLNMNSTSIENFSEHELEIFRLFGSLASLAIRKTELYATTKSSLENQKLYLSIVSHEIKAPLSAIYMLTQLMERKAKSNEVAPSAQVQRMVIESARLNQIVNEFLGNEGAQLSSRNYRWTKCSLMEILEHAKTDVSFMYSTHNITIHDGAEDDMVEADGDRLLQVFINLLSNACKYSSQGSRIVISLKKKNQYILVSIKDNGKGIPKRDLPHVFSKFYRSENQVEKGMGLGLYLAKSIIDNHKGKIAVTSKVNEGTTVTVMLKSSPVS